MAHTHCMLDTCRCKRTLVQYAKLSSFPLQQRLHERPSVLRYTYIACLVFLHFMYVCCHVGCSFLIKLRNLLRDFDVLLTVHLSIFISVINQHDAQNVCFTIPLHVSSTCAHHQEVKIALHSLWYHHTYRWPSRARDCHL